MKQLIIACLTFFLLLGCSSSDWQYLDQEPPGETPEIFAPGIISGKGRLHTYPAISPDGKQILWMILPPRTMEVYYQNDKWSEPHIFKPFSDRIYIRPGFDLKGNLYISSAQIPGGYGGLDIWLMNKTDDTIFTPINLGEPLNSDNIETGQSFSRNGDMYFTSYVPEKRWNRGIVVSKFINGKYTEPVPLPETINTPDENTIDYLSYISPDGSYILFSSNRHDTSKESCSIYVCFKNRNKLWSKAINLSNYLGLNEDNRDPALTTDGKYLFFSSGENIMWVKTSVIRKCKRNM
ncbi:MAG: hypothetical protein K9N05_04170 [Candidatus Marinimicrobia bacterium]|nr:hypothetical protein [Candidatus Neomarinimicrobiota bacterium]